MREHGLLWALMILSCVSLMGLGLSGMLVSKAQQAKAKRDARMAAVSSPHTKVQRIEISAFTRPAPVRNLSLPTMAAALFGSPAVFTSPPKIGAPKLFGALLKISEERYDADRSLNRPNPALITMPVDPFGLQTTPARGSNTPN